MNTPESVNAAVRWARGTQMGEVLIAELVALRDTLAWSGRRAAEEQREIAALREEVERLKEERLAFAIESEERAAKLDTATRALREIEEKRHAECCAHYRDPEWEGCDCTNPWAADIAARALTSVARTGATSPATAGRPRR